MSKKIILSGIQATGKLTLGNYLGAIDNWVKMQEEYDCYYMIANLHSLTVRNNPEELKNNTLRILATYIAAGLDPEKNTIFIQSQVKEHAELGWILDCYTYMGELSRMTQFKDKSMKNQNFTSGLLTYPVLMTPDILIYDTDYVPVGIDQKQHVELAREIAIRFNKKYGDMFKIPEPLIKKEGTKITDLQTPDKKMSKSSENQKGVIRLLDDLNIVRKKIMSATTDSEMIVKFDPVNKPGISNLIYIYSSLTNKNIEEIEEEFKDSNYGNFKTKVADVVVELISNIQNKYNEIINSDYLDRILDEGIEKNMEISKEFYEKMKKTIGLGRK